MAHPKCLLSNKCKHNTRKQSQWILKPRLPSCSWTIHIVYADCSHDVILYMIMDTKLLSETHQYNRLTIYIWNWMCLRTRTSTQPNIINLSYKNKTQTLKNMLLHSVACNIRSCCTIIYHMWHELQPNQQCVLQGLAVYTSCSMILSNDGRFFL